MISEEFVAMRAVDQATAELRARNAQRVAEMKAKMGRKFVLHPDNAPRKSKYKKVLRGV